MIGRTGRETRAHITRDVTAPSNPKIIISYPLTSLSPLLLLQLLLVVRVVREHDKLYSAFVEDECFWFAITVWKIVFIKILCIPEEEIQALWHAAGKASFPGKLDRPSMEDD